MKKWLVLGLSVILFGGALSYYLEIGVSAQTRRERFVAKAKGYVENSKFNEAVIEYKNALKADPAHAETHYELAMLLMKQGAVRNAYREMVRATDLDPKLTKARYQLAVMNLLGRDIIRAKQDLAKLQQQDGDGYESRYLAGQIAAIEQQPDRAIGELREAQKKEPVKGQTLIDIGRVQSSKRDFKAAEESFREAIAVNPKLLSARVALAQLLFVTGRQEKAEEELLSATKADPENEELLHVLGSFYSRTRQHDEFEKLYRDLLRKKPNSLIAKKRLAELALANNDKKQIKELVDEILKAAPDDLDGKYFRGRVYFNEKNFLKSADDFLIVTRLAPRFAPGFFHLAQTQVRLGKLAEAKRNFAKAAELLPHWQLPYLGIAQLHLAEGSTDLAREEVGKVLKAQPKNEAALMIEATVRLKQGESDKALELFKQIASDNPNNIAARFNLAATYAATKRYGEAIKQYEDVLKSAPDMIEALGGIAQIYVAQGKPTAAFARVEEALKSSETPAAINLLLGRMSYSNKDYGKAIEYLERAVNQNPELTAAYYTIGNVYATQKQFDAALDQYRKVLRKTPKAISAYMMIGTLYDKQKQIAKANEAYQKILDIDNNFAPAANNLAWNYAEHGGNLDIALTLAQKAREARGNDPSVADTLGWIYFKKKSYSTAIALFRESNEKFRERNPTVLYHLAQAYDKNGDEAAARQSVKKALALNTDFAESQNARKLLISLGDK